MIFSSVFAERTRHVIERANNGQERTFVILRFIVTCTVVAAVESIEHIRVSAIAIDIVLAGYSGQGASVGIDISLILSAATIGDDRTG